MLNISTALGMLLALSEFLFNLYHIFWEILWVFFFNCEYEFIFCLLLSIMGKQFYNILGNCKDCLTDVQKQTHIQYKEESLKAEDLVRSLATQWCYSKSTGSQVFVVFRLSLLKNLLTNFSLCSLSWFSKEKKINFVSPYQKHIHFCVYKWDWLLVLSIWFVFKETPNR